MTDCRDCEALKFTSRCHSAWRVAVRHSYGFASYPGCCLFAAIQRRLGLVTTGTLRCSVRTAACACCTADRASRSAHQSYCSARGRAARATA
eukprot:7377440-Prymnesium_polylepis.1